MKLFSEKIVDMQVSTIIVTYNRVKDLNDCLNSILIQTSLPQEVLIVDNSNNDESESLIKKRKDEFKKNIISLRYKKNEKENSLTVARNIGIENAIGEIILFLDDDVVLDKNYLKEILKVYEKYSNALGVQGYIATEKVLKIRNLINKILFLYYLEKNECKILSSVSATYPCSLNKIVSCQWLSGANHSYRRSVLEEFAYDEKLKKYSEGEDLEFSHRVFKKYPCSLYITPYAKLAHKTSPEGRLLRKELINMREVYGLYLFYKIFDRNLKNKFIYLWSRIGKLILNISRSAFKLSLLGIIENIYIFEAYIYCIKHIREIKKGNLEFFNKTLK